MSASGTRIPEIVTLGCRLNTFESEAMKKAALAAGHENLVIVNTCAVTNEAVRQARQTIRRLKRERPEARIVVTGCAAQTEPQVFAAMPEVSTVLGNDAKLDEKTWRETLPPLARTAETSADFGIGHSEKLLVNDIMSVKETAGHLIDGIEGRARAFVQVQNGCDHRCTFCIIPYGRGNSRSVPMGEVVRQVERLVDAGYREVVLTGVDLTSYGPDLPGTPTLGALCQALLDHVPGLLRLRLSSIDSIETDPLLVEMLKSEMRMMPHLHLSLQAGDNMILKRMKRRHAREDAIRFCADLRAARPDYAFGADLIAGFPTETDAMFENTLRLVEECGLAFLHVFPFSPRPGTPAARMPQLDRGLIKARAAQLREVGAAAFARHLGRHIGRAGMMLAERVAEAGKPGSGRLEDFTPVTFTFPTEAGAIVPVRITGASETHLRADMIRRADTPLLAESANA